MDVQPFFEIPLPGEAISVAQAHDGSPEGNGDAD
jgi:hypothetical protein